MKTPIQELLAYTADLLHTFDSEERVAMAVLDYLQSNKDAMLEKEKEFTTNFAMDYVFSGNVGCAIWADGPPELDIDKNARDYYKEYINTTSLDSTEWSNTKGK